MSDGHGASEASRPAASDTFHGAACTPNIGVAQRRRRFWPGVISLALGLGHGVAVAASSVTTLLLLPAALLLFAGFAGVLQSREKT